MTTFDSLVRAAVHGCDFHHPSITQAVRDIPELPAEDYLGVVVAVVNAKLAWIRSRIAANEAEIAANEAQIVALMAQIGFTPHQTVYALSESDRLFLKVQKIATDDY